MATFLAVAVVVAAATAMSRKYDGTNMRRLLVRINIASFPAPAPRTHQLRGEMQVPSPALLLLVALAAPTCDGLASFGTPSRIKSTANYRDATDLSTKFVEKACTPANKKKV